MYDFVIPVKTGIQYFQVLSQLWIPAYAGMTDFLRVHHKLIRISIYLTEKIVSIQRVLVLYYRPFAPLN